MDTASLELCKELYKLSGWVLTEKHWYHGEVLSNAPYGWDCPAYDLGYLLRKLPDGAVIVKEKLFPNQTIDNQRYNATRSGDYLNVAKTPEDAACKLAVEFFKQGILKRE